MDTQLDELPQRLFKVDNTDEEAHWEVAYGRMQSHEDSGNEPDPRMSFELARTCLCNPTRKLRQCVLDQERASNASRLDIKQKRLAEARRDEDTTFIAEQA